MLAQAVGAFGQMFSRCESIYLTCLLLESGFSSLAAPWRGASNLWLPHPGCSLSTKHRPKDPSPQWGLQPSGKSHHRDSFNDSGKGMTLASLGMEKE